MLGMMMMMMMKGICDYQARARAKIRGIGSGEWVGEAGDPR